MADVDPLPLNRDQLASFLGTHELIKRFERLFQVSGEITPSQIETLFRLAQEASIDAGLANTKAVEALDTLKSIFSALSIDMSVSNARSIEALDTLRDISRSLELMIQPVSDGLSNRLQADYIEFNHNSRHPGRVGTLSWFHEEETLEIFHPDGVVQQVGNELYAYIALNQGPDLFNGQAVGFDPGANTHVPFIADGTYNSLQIIGIATQDIPNGSPGRVTVWGRVRELDTTGTPVGEVWTAGQLLYVSTTTAGALTNVKPTAPNQSIPIAQVRVVSSTVGEVFVRPTAEQQLYYGSFTKTTDQTPAAINTAYALTWDNTEIANGVSIGAPTSRIVAANAGLYKFSLSLQLTSSSASVKNVWTWFRKNGVDVANSSMITSLDSATAIRSPSRDLFFSLLAGDYIEIMFAADSTAMTIDNIAATAFAPAAPAAILTVNQEQQ